MTFRRSTTRPARPRQRGFTLTELLVVIGLIVLLVTLAIPAFSIITGGRSIDSAQNQISAILGRARADAVGLQQERGVFFYQETAGGRVTAAIVRARSDASGATVPVALDLLPDREHLTLPNGVGVQTILNANMSPSGGTFIRSSDGYLGHNNSIQGPNPPPGSRTAVSYGGVILFDANGRLESKQYFFIVSEQTPTGNKWTPMGRLLMGLPDSDTSTPLSAPQFVSATSSGPPQQVSQVGFILFDEPTFVAQGLTDADPAVDTSIGTYSSRPTGGPTEKLEEDWIDGNGVPFLVNRYNGTLMRGE